MLSGFAAKQRAARLGAGHGYALHDCRDSFRIDLAARDVVGHEQRFGPAHDEIVDDHTDQVEADGVVAIQRLRNGDLGTNPVGGRCQHGMLQLRKRTGIEQSGEAADAADDLRTAGLSDPLLHQLDGPVPGLDVHPSRRIRRLVSVGGRSGSHGR
jgi:hypothetical protein